MIYAGAEARLMACLVTASYEDDLHARTGAPIGRSGGSAVRLRFAGP